MENFICFVLIFVELCRINEFLNLVFHSLPKSIPFGTLYFMFPISILFIYFGYSQLMCINLGNYNLRHRVDMYVQMGYNIN